VSNGPTRRQMLMSAALAGGAPWLAAPAAAHAVYGPVAPPLQAPAIPVTGSDGRPQPLRAMLSGHVTAVQLMFTGCSATCPIQGAIFADAARQLHRDDPALRLLSISIDPLGDDARALAAWLGRFGPPATRWRAAVLAAKDVDPLIDFLRGRASGADRHTAQAFLFDRQARLAFRTVDMPAGADLAALMRQLAARR
jgi:protein SCO1